MQVELDVEGSALTVEVDLAGRTVRIGEKSYPFVVVSAEGERVELDISGEKAVVDGWPPHNGSPTGRLSVNGETVRLGRLLRTGSLGPPAAGRDSAPSSPPGGPPAPAATSPPPSERSGGGVPIRPPMPGKVLEVRVREGESVAAGQVLLVLEAMKMRNEVTSPSAGKVSGLTVLAGANVRAKDVLLTVVPAT